jgi:CheY-like chemotaxis protein/HPt (histidine-containing phosphotransfer) domain-containing protein
LVVDDSLANRTLALMQLERLGCGAEAVDGAETALGAVGRGGIALVLMDCQMPLVDGFEAARRIREHERATGAARLPIVAITAAATDHDRQASLEAGMDDFETKPLSLQSLQAVLQRWLPGFGDGPPVASGRTDPGIDGVDPVDVGTLEGMRDDLGDTAARRFVSTFLAEIPIRLEAIARASDALDAGELGRAAHALRGSSAAVGAGALLSICRELEAWAGAGGSGSWPEIARLDPVGEATAAGLRAWLSDETQRTGSAGAEDQDPSNR